jgi:2-hydroxychromene-2-carboxylate isomerase
MMPDQTSEKAEVNFKSPYAYLALDPGMALGERFDVRVRWIPFQLRLKGKRLRRSPAPAPPRAALSRSCGFPATVSARPESPR